MRPSRLDPELVAALERYRQGSGVIEYFAFQANHQVGLELHRTASLEAFDVLRSALETEHFKLTLHPERMRAHVISVQAFFGQANTSAGPMHSPLEFLEARARELNSRKAFSGGLNDCYLHAFSDPPYGLGFSPPEAQLVFDTINQHVFGSFADDLEIMRWSSDWSNYFEAGLEWWGAYWWSIHNRSKHLVLVMAASATD